MSSPVTATVGTSPLQPARTYVRTLLLVAGVVLVMCLQVAVATTPLYQRDERAHASYAIALAHGDLPTIDTPMPDDPGRYPRLARILQRSDARHATIWTANHPPLYYALSVPLVWAGDALGEPEVTYLGMRVLDALGFTVAAALAALVAGELVPRRRGAVTLIAAGVVLSCGVIPYRGGAIYNDGLATAAALGVLLASLRLIRHGPSTRAIALLAVVAAAAAASRSTGLVAVALGCAAVVVAYVLRERTRRGLLRGVAAAVPVGLVPAAATGWFYLRNLRLYGSATGSGALFERFGRTPTGSTAGVLLDPVFHWDLFRALWTDEAIHNALLVVPVAVLAVMVAALGVEARDAGGVVGAGRRWRDRLRAEDVAGWLLTLGYLAVLLVGTASFVAGGGFVHARYALPQLPLVAAVLALAALRVGAAVGKDEAWVVRSVLLAGLVAGLAAHVALELRLDPPLRDSATLTRIVLGDLVVLGTAGLLAREVCRPSAQPVDVAYAVG